MNEETGRIVADIREIKKQMANGWEHKSLELDGLRARLDQLGRDMSMNKDQRRQLRDLCSSMDDVEKFMDTTNERLDRLEGNKNAEPVKYAVGDYVVSNGGTVSQIEEIDGEDYVVTNIGWMLSCKGCNRWNRRGVAGLATPQEIRGFLEEKYTVRIGGGEYIFHTDDTGNIFTVNGKKVFATWLYQRSQHEILQRANIPVMSPKELQLWKAGE